MAHAELDFHADVAARNVCAAFQREREIGGVSAGRYGEKRCLGIIPLGDLDDLHSGVPHAKIDRAVVRGDRERMVLIDIRSLARRRLGVEAQLREHGIYRECGSDIALGVCDHIFAVSRRKAADVYADTVVGQFKPVVPSYGQVVRKTEVLDIDEFGGIFTAIIEAADVVIAGNAVEFGLHVLAKRPAIATVLRIAEVELRRVGFVCIGVHRCGGKHGQDHHDRKNKAHNSFFHRQISIT